MSTITIETKILREFLDEHLPEKVPATDPNMATVMKQLGWHKVVKSAGSYWVRTASGG